MPGDEAALTWPRFRVDPPIAKPGDPVRVWITDAQPWPFVLLTINGEPATPEGWHENPGGTYTWIWGFAAPEDGAYDLIFYHDCHTGCVERGQVAVGVQPDTQSIDPIPTKLGLVLPSQERDWHNRSGWAVEIAYASRSEELYWGLDDLAMRVAQHQAKGLRVLLRVDYDSQQSLPATGNYLMLTEYLDYLRRLARDDRFQGIYGYIIGNDYNVLDANTLDPENPVTPEWYARIFSGYGEDVTHSDNAVQVIHTENPQARVLVGPVRPWCFDQDGAQTYTIDVPWLNYMNTLVTYLDQVTQEKAAAGIPLVAPDGFDVQSPGRPDAPELGVHLRADEPLVDLPRAAWNGAQAGFRVYRDWIAIINDYPSMRGLPVYIISTNTYDRESEIPPAQNYPQGWLTNALAVVETDPQIVALCWFLDDFPHSEQWNWFSLSQQPGRLVDAAAEFDTLLRGE